MHNLSRNFRQRHEHKPPQMHPRMRHLQFRRVNRFRPVQQNVHIDLPRPLRDQLLAAHFCFDFAQKWAARSCPFLFRFRAKPATTSWHRNAFPPPRRNSKTTVAPANPLARFHRGTTLFSPPRPHVAAPQSPRVSSWRDLRHWIPSTSTLFSPAYFVIEESISPCPRRPLRTARLARSLRR